MITKLLQKNNEIIPGLQYTPVFLYPKSAKVALVQQGGDADTPKGINYAATPEKQQEGETHRKLEKRGTLKTERRLKIMNTKSKLRPLNLQFFAEDDGNANAGNEPGKDTGTPNGSQRAFDYEKLASIINGRQSATEDAVLKNYFKQQGLSQEEAAQAISTFKAEKAKNTPDLKQLQSQLSAAQKAAEQASIEKEAFIAALGLGLDSKTIPYAVKLANFEKAVGEDGKINAESVKAALEKVLEDIPNLKPSRQPPKGFQVGGAGNNNNNKTSEDQLNAAFGL